MRIALLVLGLLSLSACCCTVAPAEDYPVIPLPEKTLEQVVDGIKKEGGIFLPDSEVKKVAMNLENLRAERDALRKLIEKYNEWALEKSGGP